MSNLIERWVAREKEARKLHKPIYADEIKELLAELKRQKSGRETLLFAIKFYSGENHALIGLRKLADRADAAISALAKVHDWLREPDWAAEGWSLNNWLSRRPTIPEFANGILPANAPRPLDEWHEDFGNVVWWALGDDGNWLGEPAYIGSPLDCGRTISVVVDGNEMTCSVGGWPGYHTHWTPHPEMPPLPENTGNKHG